VEKRRRRVRGWGKKGGRRLFTVMGTKCWQGTQLFKVIITESYLNPSVPGQLL
jgi:hypothetical protein